MARLPLARSEDHITHTLQGIDKGEVGDDFAPGMSHEMADCKEAVAWLRRARLEAQLPPRSPVPTPEQADLARRDRDLLRRDPKPGETPTAAPLPSGVPGEQIAPPPPVTPQEWAQAPGTTLYAQKVLDKVLDEIELAVQAEGYPAVRNSLPDDLSQDDNPDGWGLERNADGLEDDRDSIKKKDSPAVRAHAQ